jgi:hypothetical protein
VRSTRFARKVLAALTAGLAALTTAAVPAYALSASPRTTPAFNGSVFAIAYRGETVYVGGSFTSVVSGGHSYNRQRLAAFDARSGALLTWAPSADATVRTLAVAGDSVYAAGDFGKISGWRRDSLARINAADGRLGTFAHTLSGTAYRLAVGNGRLYLGGRFTAVDGVPRVNLAAFTLADDRLDPYWRPITDDAVHTVVVAGARVYVGGVFHQADQVAGAGQAVALTGPTGAVDPTFLPKPESPVNGIAADSTGVYVATGGQGGRVIAYTTTGHRRWQRVFDGDAAAVRTLDGVVYVGGHFDKVCQTLNNGDHGNCTDGSASRIKLAAFDRAGTLTDWAPQANGVIGVRTVEVDPATDTIGVGGDFTQIDGQVRYRYAGFS